MSLGPLPNAAADGIAIRGGGDIDPRRFVFTAMLRHERPNSAGSVSIAPSLPTGAIIRPLSQIRCR
jgi:hypothetical protein